jgi:hypothetical protein
VLHLPVRDSTYWCDFYKTSAGEKAYFKILFRQEMGLPMNNLHAPTVPSGPTSGPQGDRSALDRLSLMELISRKDNLEAELKALGSVLDSVSRIAFTGLARRNGLTVSSKAWGQHEHEPDNFRRISTR